ncbi:hypothetical protein LTR84_006063 [Exophiala bonariae]|uniref:Uncharacterized protein n=1 Tax=Exophiala bonariae TaxID=1690606 RepID=A0AAV9N481_9EURO|nr:hypothetical protein LTR84_006063 [Exophiala bonariae]
MASYLVTGASRGIGLELVKQLGKLPADQVSIVFAATRTKEPSAGLQQVIDASDGKIAHILLPITDKAGIAAAVPQLEARLGDKGLDVLVNNAGVMGYTPGGTAAMTDLRETFEVNVEAVHNTTVALLPLVQKSKLKKVINISTTMGSMALAANYKFAPTPAYKITKAALNMLTVQYAQDFAQQGVTFLAVSPGWLKTDLGSQMADLEVDVGVKEVVRIIQENGIESSGKFLNIRVPGWENKVPNAYDGKSSPW